VGRVVDVQMIVPAIFPSTSGGQVLHVLRHVRRVDSAG
jgi:hypothetical protein